MDKAYERELYNLLSTDGQVFRFDALTEKLGTNNRIGQSAGRFRFREYSVDYEKQKKDYPKRIE